MNHDRYAYGRMHRWAVLKRGPDRAFIWAYELESFSFTYSRDRPMTSNSSPLTVFSTPPVFFPKFDDVSRWSISIAFGVHRAKGWGWWFLQLVFQDFQLMWPPSTNVTDTDRQTDDMRWQYRALHWSASHGKKTENSWSAKQYNTVL